MNESGFPVLNKNLGKYPSGQNPIEWDGRNENDELVSSGIYIFIIDADDQILGPKKFAVLK